MTAVASPPVAPGVRSDRIAQLKASGVLVAALAVVGALLGPIWAVWSPAGPAGAVLAHGIQADETEAFIAGDGRFGLIVLIVGLAAGVAAWYVPLLKRTRGPYVAIALAVGGAVGAGLTEWLGYLVRGQGNSFACNSDTGKCITHLPLTVHMHALLLVEAIAAVLVYSLFVAFAVADDLGRPELRRRTKQAPAQPEWPPAPMAPVAPPATAPVGPSPPVSPPVGLSPPVSPPVGWSPPPPSVRPQGDPQESWGHRDAPGGPQQDDLAT